MIVTSTGAYSGKFTLGADLYSFSGAHVTVDETGVNPPQAQFLAKRTGKTPLNVSLVFDPAHNRLASGTISNGAGEEAPGASISGWRNVWSNSAPANDYKGYHTFRWQAQEVAEPSEDNRPVPQGHGYGSFKIAPNGTVPLAGKLADGTICTGSSFISEDGDVLVYQSLYTTADRGSICGTLVVSNVNHAVSGSIHWTRGATTLASARTYPQGFSAEFNALGGLYTPPVSPKVVLGIDPGTLNAQVDIILAEDDIITQDLSIGANSRISYPAGVKVSALTVNPFTGVITGTYTRQDQNPLNSAQTIIRKGNYTGIVVNEGSTPMKGYGFTLLPRLPQQAGQTITKTLIDSFAVELSAKE